MLAMLSARASLRAVAAPAPSHWQGPASPCSGAVSRSRRQAPRPCAAAADPFGGGSKGSASSNPFGGGGSSGRRKSVGGGTSVADPFSGGSGRAEKRASDPFAASPVSPAPRRQPVDDASSSAPVPKRHPEECEVFPVEPGLRAPGAAPVTQWVEFHSLEDVFPGSGLAAKFDEDGAFRAALHQATRDDLFVPSPKFSKEANDRIKGPGSTLCTAWTKATTDPCPNVSRVFEEYGVTLDGAAFIAGLGALIRRGEVTTGSLTDIVGIGRNRVNHSWHQDSGLDQWTLMMGFPSEDGYDGPGVFSHVVKLDYPLRPSGEEGAVIEYERFEPQPPPIPEKYIMRPVYRRGKEIMLYRDSDHLHSAPDLANRKAVWRFM